MMLSLVEGIYILIYKIIFIAKFSGINMLYFTTAEKYTGEIVK